MSYIDDFAVDSTVPIHFTTNAANGGKVDPSDPFDLADIRIYKGTSATQRTSTSGWTISSPFDTETGAHALSIDLSDNTDAGFYAAGNDYFVYLIPDTETVDTQSVASIIGHFSIENRYINAALIKTQIVDAIFNDVKAELSSVPASDAPIGDKLTWLTMLARNKGDQTATAKQLYADDDATVVGTSNVSSDGTKFTRGKYT